MTTRPRHATGRHALPSLDGPRLRAPRARPEDAAALQACLDGAPGYFELTEGGPAAPDHAERLLEDALADPARRVHLLIPRQARGGSPGGGGLVAGVLDLHLDHPGAGDAHVGLLLFRESCQGIGYGAETVGALVHALSAAGYRALRASVGDENPEARVFWEQVGFAEAERLDRGVTVLERVLG